MNITADPWPGVIGLRVGPHTFDRPEGLRTIVQGLRTTDLADATRGRGVIHGVRSIASPTPVVGFAVTVDATHGGFDIVKLGLQLCQPGDVLVVAGHGQPHALWGGNLSRGARARGLNAVLVDGNVRDAEEITQLGFGVWARSTSVSAAPVQLPEGEVNVPVAVGGAVVFPGDLVVLDADGAITVRQADVPNAAELVSSIRGKHQEVRHVLDAGRVTSMELISDRLQLNGMHIPQHILSQLTKESQS